MTAVSLQPPLLIHRETVRPEWIDYNGHMNVAFYVMVFDHATDGLLDALNLGRAYRDRERCSVFVVESHIAYRREITAGEALAVATRLLGFDDKRLHFFQWLAPADGSGPAAMMEVMAVHVDMGTRRAAPFAAPAREALRRLLDRHAPLEWPREAGRRIRPLAASTG